MTSTAPAVALNKTASDALCLSIPLTLCSGYSINGYFGHDEPQGHAQNDVRRNDAVRDDRTKQVRRRVAGAGQLDEPTGHAEQQDTGHEGHDRREPDRGER